MSRKKQHETRATKSVPPPVWQEERDNSVKFKAKTKGQQIYLDALNNRKLVFCDGPAGTGKSLLACVAAAEALKSGKVDKIIICRPLVACEDMGFLPGDMEEKSHPYLQHIIYFLEKLLPGKKIADFVRGGVIEFFPLAFMRGSTHNRCFVILDEAQNATKKQLDLFLTRIGEDSVFVVNGDMTQTDIYNSGFGEVLERFSVDDEEIETVILGINDIVRSALVKKIVKLLTSPLPSITHHQAKRKNA